MSEPSEIRVGTVLGETYEITDLLGQGGMGAVWSAKHLRLPGKRVAIKVLHGLAANDRESYARFRREAEIASRIGHPNIVTVHDFNVLASGTPYLVLEYLDGEDLSQRLARGPLPLATALNIARQIGSALHAAHKADVVHRDLKPGNVFLMATEIGGELVDQVKVLDFGISKIRGSQTVQTQDSVLLGTPQYMAPEQALGKNTEIDGRTDVFALGAIVYEMISGRAAFMGSTLAEVVFKVVYDKQPPLGELAPSTPKNVLDAVEQALAKDPNARFADVAAFINALTGRPLQTLDRARAKNPAPEAFASTQAAAGVAPSQPPGVQTTGARGEVAPAIPPTTTARVADGKKAAFIVGALLAAIGGTLGVIKLTAKPPAELPPVAGTATLPPKVETPIAPPPIAPPPIAPPPLAPPTGATVVAPPPKVELQSSKVAAPSKKESLPPEIAAELDAAEKAIDGEPAEAVRQARHTLSTAKSSRAFSIIARGFCKQGDLGNAKAALHSVGGGDRGRVLKYCKAAGTDLQ
ncbi:MAG: serine/threonine-protein kinase [bacterium]|nr:serine/threonine-protein kinase [bacterium]